MSNYNHKRNFVFWYTERLDPDKEIMVGEKFCLEPRRTKLWKDLEKTLGQVTLSGIVHKVGYYVAVPELDENIEAIENEVTAIKKEFWGQDEGTCVLGMFLKYKGRKIADQIAQGSITNERFLNAVKAKLIEKFSFDKNGFYLEYGRMD